jgi:environmental stress-induced protein Ves
MTENNFIWRLSTAKISEDGPFSLYKNYQRSLAVTNGTGLELNINDKTHKLNKGQVVTFSGNTPVTCRLNQGPVQDLNLIFKPQQIETSLEIFSKDLLDLTILNTAFFIFAFDEALQISLNNSTPAELDRLESLHIEPEYGQPVKLSILTPKNAMFALIKLSK